MSNLSLKARFWALICVLSLAHGTPIDNLCDLVWEQGRDGEFSQDAVDGGYGGLIVRARAGAGGSWMFGRLVPGDLVALVPVGSGQVEHSEYEVLTHSNGCNTEWIEITNISAPIPTSGVGADNMFVGRGIYDGYTIAGTLQSSTSLIVVYEGAVVQAAEPFEVLVSTYPELEGTLTNFQFNREVIDELERRAYKRLIGMDHVDLQASDTALVQHTIAHDQTIQEFFELQEAQEWIGIQHISVQLLPWFGSPILEGSFATVSGAILELNRDRLLSVHKELTQTNASNLQACSFAVMVDDEQIPFEAVGKFSSSQLSGAGVASVLEKTGREATRVNGNTVTAKVSGFLRGKFALRVMSVLAELEPGTAPCVAEDF